jgi:hypothetical protein
MNSAEVIHRTARIDSYFSLPTDLANEMKEWSSFVSGSGYDVLLRTEEETVDIRFVPASSDDAQHVVVSGKGTGELFPQALGTAIYALAAHSDNVSVCQWRAEA